MNDLLTAARTGNTVALDRMYVETTLARARECVGPLIPFGHFVLVTDNLRAQAWLERECSARPFSWGELCRAFIVDYTAFVRACGPVSTAPCRPGLLVWELRDRLRGTEPLGPAVNVFAAEAGVS